MKTTKFEIVKNSKEVRYKDRQEIKQGCTLDQDNQYPEVIKSFDNKEDALLEIQNYKTEIVELNSNGVYYLVTEFYVEENVYNEAGEREQSEGIWEYSKMPLTDWELENIASYMDDEKRELVCDEMMAWNTNIDFLKRYLELHPEFKELLKDEFEEVLQLI